MSFIYTVPEKVLDTFETFIKMDSFKKLFADKRQFNYDYDIIRSFSVYELELSRVQAPEVIDLGSMLKLRKYHAVIRETTSNVLRGRITAHIRDDELLYDVSNVEVAMYQKAFLEAEQYANQVHPDVNHHMVLVEGASFSGVWCHDPMDISRNFVIIARSLFSWPPKGSVKTMTEFIALVLEDLYS